MWSVFINNTVPRTWSFLHQVSNHGTVIEERVLER
jgi:hypothetical protein